MNTFLSMAKRIPWWAWVAGIVFLILVWQQMSSWAMSRKLYSMALDNLREDQSNVIQSKEEWIKTCEEEITKLQTEKEQLQKEKALVQRQANESAAVVTTLKRRVNVLETQLQNVVVPDDPDRIIDNLHKHGLKSIRRHRDKR